MRIAAPSSVGQSRRPVRAPVRDQSVRHRGAAPVSSAALFRVSEPRPEALMGVVAQSIHHMAHAGRAEESLVHANGAYRKADDLRFRSQPYLSKVA